MTSTELQSPITTIIFDKVTKTDEKVLKLRQFPP